MPELFTPSQRHALQELLGLPARLRPAHRTPRLQADLSDVRRILGLAPPPFVELASPTTWILGGSVLRWLCGGIGQGSYRTGDLDLFFPSAEAFNRTGRRLMEQGWRFRGFTSRTVMCHRCGRPAEINHPGPESMRQRFPEVSCTICGITGGEKLHALAPEELLVLSPELIHDRLIVALELVGPDGTITHLSATGIRPDLATVIGVADYSLAQFAIDGTALHFGPYTWTDLLLGRFRQVRHSDTWGTFHRLAKYRSFGFRPYVGTAANVNLRYAAYRLKVRLRR
jgi:hypothetical protein